MKDSLSEKGQMKIIFSPRFTPFKVQLLQLWKGNRGIRYGVEFYEVVGGSPQILDSSLVSKSPTLPVQED